MQTSEDKNFSAVRAFHLLMDGEVAERPQVFNLKEAGQRSEFKIEEIVEFMAASSHNQIEFERSLQHLHQAIDNAGQKVYQKGAIGGDNLVGQVDALIDILYFTYGSFVLMGVDPAPIFDVVHAANMGKIWPDGCAHHDPVTNKILKPENWERDYAPEEKIKRILSEQKKD